MAGTNKKRDDKVRVKLPKINKPNVSQDFFCSLNGKNYIIQRGEWVTIPRALKKVIDYSFEAEQEAIEYAEANGIREP